MTTADHGLADGAGTNAALGWLVLAVLAVLAVERFLAGDRSWALATAGALGLALVSPVVARSPHVMVPWEVLVLLAAPLVAGPLAPEPIGGRIVRGAGTAMVALVMGIQLHAFTPVRMNRPFAAVFVAMATAALSAGWTTALWAADLLVGTAFLGSNAQVMWELIAATGAGLLVGVAGAEYVHGPADQGGRPDRAGTGSQPEESGEEREPWPGDDDGREASRAISERLGLSERQQQGIVRILQAGIAAVLGVGIVTLDPGLVANAVVALGVTFLPAVFEREYDLPMDVGLTLWISVALFLHALGALWFYGDALWWHNLTHLMSATLVGAVGYAAARAVDEHTDAVQFSPRFTFAFIVLFVLFAGVVWEIFEFALDGATATLGVEEADAQHGLADTMTDLVFNTIGALVVAAWGTAYLTDVASSLGNRLDDADPSED